MRKYLLPIAVLGWLFFTPFFEGKSLAQIGYQVTASTITATSLFKAADGTLAAPSYTLTNDTDTGFYSTGDDCLGLSQGGNDLGQWCVATGTLTATQIRKLNATPVTVIAAPGMGEAILLDTVRLHLDYGTVAFDDDASGEDLVFQYATNNNSLMECDHANCIDADATADNYAQIFSSIVANGRTIVANDAIEVTISNGEWAAADMDANGDSVIHYLIRYRIVTVDLS